MHADRAKTRFLERASIKRRRAFQVAVKIALDVVCTREQAEVRDATQPLRQRVHSRPEHRSGDVVQHIITNDDVELLASADRAERGEVALANVATSAETPDCVRAWLDAQVIEMRALTPERRTPEPFSASNVECVACTAAKQLFRERNDRASDACALGSGGNAMPRVAVPAIVIRLAEAVGQLALRGISTRSGA